MAYFILSCKSSHSFCNFKASSNSKNIVLLLSFKKDNEAQISSKFSLFLINLIIFVLILLFGFSAYGFNLIKGSKILKVGIS